MRRNYKCCLQCSTCGRTEYAIILENTQTEICWWVITVAELNPWGQLKRKGRHTAQRENWGLYRLFTHHTHLTETLHFPPFMELAWKMNYIHSLTIIEPHHWQRGERSFLISGICSGEKGKKALHWQQQKRFHSLKYHLNNFLNH